MGDKRKMTEVILNDECMHCVHKECHDGYHFCNQAMKDNSFYKNKKLYKGLEVIQRPTYEELEKENAEAKNLIEELASSLSVVGECGEEECELINKAQKFINKPIF